MTFEDFLHDLIDCTGFIVFASFWAVVMCIFG